MQALVSARGECYNASSATREHISPYCKFDLLHHHAKLIGAFVSRLGGKVLSESSKIRSLSLPFSLLSGRCRIWNPELPSTIEARVQHVSSRTFPDCQIEDARTHTMPGSSSVSTHQALKIKTHHYNSPPSIYSLTASNAAVNQLVTHFQPCLV